MPEYIYLLHPFRDGFFEQPTPTEKAIMGEHVEYLKQATVEGDVLLSGSCLDDTFGLIIFRAENEQAAQAFMLNDPLVKKKCHDGRTPSPVHLSRGEIPIGH